MNAEIFIFLLVFTISLYNLCWDFLMDFIDLKIRNIIIKKDKIFVSKLLPNTCLFFENIDFFISKTNKEYNTNYTKESLIEILINKIPQCSIYHIENEHIITNVLYNVIIEDMEQFTELFSRFHKFNYNIFKQDYQRTIYKLSLKEILNRKNSEPVVLFRLLGFNFLEFNTINYSPKHECVRHLQNLFEKVIYMYFNQEKYKRIDRRLPFYKFLKKIWKQNTIT